MALHHGLVVPSCQMVAHVAASACLAAVCRMEEGRLLGLTLWGLVSASVVPALGSGLVLSRLRLQQWTLPSLQTI